MTQRFLPLLLAGVFCLTAHAAEQSCGMDFGNDSAFPADTGWTNIGVPSATIGSANTLKAIPLKKNGGDATTSPIAVGSLFGRTVSLTLQAKASVATSNTTVTGGTNTWLWRENGKFHTNASGIVAGASSQFALPNNCEAFTTSSRLTCNGQAAATGAQRLAFAGLAPGKVYTVTIYIGTDKPAYEAVSLVSGVSRSVSALGTSQGSASGSTFTGQVNASDTDAYLAVEWAAEADASGALVFDVQKLGNSAAKGYVDINAVTIATDDTPAPVLPDPRPIASIHNKALISLPVDVALPVPATEWSDGGTLTCELWIRPSDDAATCPILSLGSLSLQLKDGRLRLEGATGSPSLAASSTTFQAGVWHHVAVSLGTSSVKLLIDGTEAASDSSPAAFAEAMRDGWEGIVLASEFRGSRDEIRFWDAALAGNADEDQSDFWRHGPLAMGHPKYAHLVGNWRLDGDFRDVKWTEFAPQTGSRHTTPWSALTPANAEFAIVSDNDIFRYKLTSAYVREGHIIYRWLSRATLINNSDLICIGGITVGSDGRIASEFPDNDVTDLAESGVEFLPTDGNRTNVYNFPEAGPGMHAGGDLLTGCNAAQISKFTIEANMALSADEEEATLLENDNFSLKLTWAEDHYKAFIQIGTDYAYEADLPASLAKNEYFWLAFVLWKDDTHDSASFYLGKKALATNEATVGTLEGTANVVIGKGFVGKIDELRVWNEARTSAQLTEVPIHDWVDRLMRARWGDSDVPGHDTASWAEHFRYLQRMTQGVGGMRIRFDIAGGSWVDMIADQTKREAFAASIAETIAKYSLDGVDLDFEWIYNDTTKWNNLGKTIQVIRAANPDTNFSVSLHTVSYALPASAMQYVDSFTFQNYGPDIDVNSYNSMVNACKSFRNHGFPDNKIILSAPFQGTPGTANLPNGKKPGVFIKLYRDFAHYPEVADPDCDQVVVNYGKDGDLTLHFNGVTTIRKKAKYIANQKLAGFMYWDCGGDIIDGNKQTDYFSERSLLRAANRYNGSTAYPITPPVFTLDRAGLSMPAVASNAALAVQAEDATLGWIVAEKPDWVSVDTPGSLGDATIVVSATENPTVFERSGVIRFVASSTGQECVCVVTQAAGTESSGFDKWRKKYFPGGESDPNSAPGANPAHDGISNLMKYALGLDPFRKYGSVGVATASSATPPATLTITYPRNNEATDIEYIGERLVDPDDVSTGWTSEHVATDTQRPGEVSIHCELQNTAASPKQIMRLRVRRVEDAQ